MRFALFFLLQAVGGLRDGNGACGVRQRVRGNGARPRVHAMEYGVGGRNNGIALCFMSLSHRHETLEVAIPTTGKVTLLPDKGEPQH